MGLIEQIIQRRNALGWKQSQLASLLGMSRQQVQRIEAGGNPRLDTLNLVSKGLECQLMLVPQNKVHLVQAILSGQETGNVTNKEGSGKLSDDPWSDLLKGLDE